MTSLRASEKGLEIVNSARIRRGWSKSSDAWADLAKVSSGTLKRFWQGKAIRSDSFQEICHAIGVYSWIDIADFNSSENESFKSDIAAHFITGNPILDPKLFFGRDAGIRRIFSILNRHPLQNIAVMGKKRSGKTSLLHYISKITKIHPENLRADQKSHWLKNSEAYNWIFIDFQDRRMMNQNKLLGYILSQMGLQDEHQLDLELFMEIFSSNIKKPTVILFDEIDGAIQPNSPLDDPFWESLRSLGTNHSQGNLSFVLASSSLPSELAHSTGYISPFFNIFGHIIKLGPLTETEAYELMRSSPIPFSSEDEKWIISESQCWPLLLQILCSERLFSLEESEKEGTYEGFDWQAQGLMEIERFRYLLDSN
ncbi:MAG: ATP-binding protein [Cyanobacteria bacterium P01_A01_bin.123]